MKTDTAQQNIPSGWRLVKLNEVCSIEPGVKAPEGVLNYLEIGDVDIERKDYDLKDKIKTTIKGSVKVPKNTLLISKVRPTRGAVTITKSELNVSQAFTRIRLDNKYLYFIVTQDKFFEYLGSTTTGSTYPTTKDEDILNFEFPYTPVVKEQEKIAEVLGAVDDEITKTHEVIEASEKMKRGLMHQFFTHGIRGADLEKLKLGDLVNYVKGYAFKTDEFKNFGSHRIIKVSDLSESAIKETGTTFLNGEISKYEKWILHTNDLILTTVGSRPPLYSSMVGRAILVPGSFDGSLLNQNSVLLRAKETMVNPKYLYYALKQVSYTKHVEKIIRGNANQANITLAGLFKYLIPVSSLSTQQEVAEILSAVDEKISINKKLKEKLTLLKKGLMQDLLSGTVRTNI